LYTYASSRTWADVQAILAGAGYPSVYAVDYTSWWQEPGDLWSIGGGFAPGTWAFRIAVEVRSSWVTALGDGTFSAPWTDPAQAPVSGTAAAVPEPASLLLLSAGLAALGARRYRRRSQD
jgi:hypothetical protein